MKLKITQQRGRERRRRILDAATRVFGDRGLAVASLTEVARAAEVTAAQPLRLLSGQAGADRQRSRPQLRGAVRAQIVGRRHLWGATASALQAIVEYIVGNPSWGRVFFLEIWPSVLAAHPAIRRSIDAYGRWYVRILAAGITRGEFRRDLDPHRAMSLLLGAMCHLTAVWLLYRRPFDLCPKGEAAFAALYPTFSREDPHD